MGEVIRHCVMLRLRAAPCTELAAIMTGLKALVADLGGLSGFGEGPNLDFEDKSPGFTYGFTFDAVDADRLHAYAQHPEHKALGARLVALCHGGADGIRVYDLKVQT